MNAKIGQRIMIMLLITFLAVSVIQAQDDRVVVEDLTIVANGDEIADGFAPDVTTRLYAFQATAGDSVTITMTQSSDILDPFLVLLGGTGEVLATDDDSGSAFLAAEIAGYPIPEDGTYLVLATSLAYIEGIADETIDTLDYTLRISGQTTPAETPDAGNPLQFEQIQYGSVTTGASTVEAPVIFYAFEGTAGDSVNILVKSDEYPTVLYLFGANGDRLMADPSAITDFVLPEDGLYLILTTDVFFYESLAEDGFYLGGAFSLMLDQ